MINRSRIIVLGLLLVVMLFLFAWQSRTLPSFSITSTSQNAGSATNAGAPTHRCTDQLPETRRFGLPPWPRTDFCRHSVPYDEIRSGGVSRDRIPAIDQPIFETVQQADLWLAAVEPVIVFQLEDDVRAYPISVLIWHEIVNDIVAEQPIVITYCPLCNSALAFERTVNGMVLDFGTTGNLRNANLIMYDRQTESWWQQFTGEAIVGSLTGERLQFMAANIISWADFKAQYPTAQVLSADTGYERFYGETPYRNYDTLTNTRIGFYDGELDRRLPPTRRVLALQIGEVAIAYPYSVLSENAVVNDTQSEQPLVVFWKPGTASPLYKRVIADSKDVGSAVAYSRVVEGQTLSFVPADDAFQDRETGSTWNLFGTAIAGPLAGQQLKPMGGHELFWFAWAAFKPGTLVYTAP